MCNDLNVWRFYSFSLVSSQAKEKKRDSNDIKRMKCAWSLIFVWLWEIWNEEALFGKERRAESSSNRHWLPTFWSCCFIKFILVSMIFFQPFSIYSCWEITLVLLHTVCVCHILFLYPSGWNIAIVVVGCRPVRVLLLIIFSFLLIALTLTLNADGRWPPKKNTPLPM